MKGVWQFIGGQFAVAGPVVLFMMIAALNYWRSEITLAYLDERPRFGLNDHPSISAS